MGSKGQVLRWDYWISILGDPGADSGDKGQSKRATKKISEEKS